jgi:hypothetical protein
MAADEDAIPVNIDSVDANADEGGGSWNIPNVRPDAESAPTIPLDRPAADWFKSGYSDE